MTQHFHENRSHGTSIFPLQIYSHKDTDGFYFVSQHWHKEFEWIYVDYGQLELVIHGRTYSLTQNQFCFINSEELHEIKSVGHSLHHAIVFQPNFLDFALYDICQYHFIQPITHNKVLFPTLLEKKHGFSEQILSHMQTIVKNYHAQTTTSALCIKLHLLHIVELLYQTGAFKENTSTQKEMESLNHLKMVIEYIHNNYQNPITLQELANLAYMTPNYFCSYFKQKTGKSPVSFINEYRIQKASQLLEATDNSISQIATDTGFDNFSYFIRKFKEIKGLTPSKYRSLI